MTDTRAAADVGPRSAIDVGRLLDTSRWGGYQGWLVFLTALTIIFDGIDNQLLGVAIPAIMKDWGVVRSAFSPVVSCGYLGMAVGGALAGIAGDRVGRRTALLVTLVVFGVMTTASAEAHSISVLVILRMAAGLGLGGAMPNAAALAAEYVPLRQRFFAVTLTIVCVPLGATLAGLLALRFLPVLGWRALFAIGGAIPVVAAALLRTAMPESPRFLARRPSRWPELRRLLGRMGHPSSPGATFEDSSERAKSVGSVVALFSGEYVGDTLALWGAFFFSLMAVYLVFSWLPSLLASAGLGSAANTGITAFNMGGVIGAIAGGRGTSRFGSRVLILAVAAGSVLSALAMSTMAISAAGGVLPLIVMLAITGGLINATQTMMYGLAAHVYPTMLRATGVGTAVAIGRIGAIVSGYAGPWAIAYRGSASFFELIAVSMAVSFLCLALVRRHVTGLMPQLAPVTPVPSR